jgi:hypothetical protein
MTLVVATLLGMMALGSDVGVMYYNWVQLQKAADAAAIAGATYFLPQNTTQTLPTPMIAAGCNYATQQQNVACTYALNDFAQPADLSQGGIYVPAQNPPGNLPAGAQTIQVTLKRTNIPVFFMRALGRTDTYAAIASSTAIQPTAVTSIHNGLLPAGMPPNPLNNCPANTPGGCFSYGTQFQMAENYAPGTWGWLDIPSPAVTGGGASLLASNITNGCTFDIKVGDSISTKPGQSWGQVQPAVNGRITGGNLPATITGNESQLVTVPIVDWGTVNGASQVKVLGFAEVWLDSLTKTGSNQKLMVQFVKYVSKYASGAGGSSSEDYGAYQPQYLVQ